MHVFPNAIPFSYLPVVLFLVLLCTINAACVSSAPAVPTESGIGSTSPDSSGPFLYQNIVNTSRGVEGFLNNSGKDPEARRSVAIRDAMDSRDPVTRDYAVSLIPRAHGGTFNLAQICDLWENVYSRWTYVDDPRGEEYFSPASRTIALGFKGDCDDFAIVVAAMIESVGGSARIVTAKNGTSGHAYSEVYIGNTSEQFEEAAAYIRQRYHVTDVGCHITTDADGPRYWLNLDWWSTHPGGRFFADDGVRIAYYPDGRWEPIETWLVRPG
ncbi:MAG: transglutaminase-like domain-containing protein [Methanoregula sp.]|uniref:transglutaminase domain-containing protein n=1 Tax=Methanoregula sp. TaxID=2052170 RepID=UPI0025DE6767|nr:transglutaminase domain-containing protein [Methanoregula sp.]MCK9630581.1 transglutaminase-like domain-containing protein [Methanoregula sp.]